MNGMNSRHELEVSKLLHEFAKEGLKSREGFVAEAKLLAEQVVTKLHKNLKKYKIAEGRYAGSFGKKTDVLQPDLDLVVVVNDCEPPYDKVLEEFEDILLMNETELKIRPATITRKTKFSLQFLFENGIEVDLLPAANLEPDQVYKMIAKNPEKYYNYSSCLVAKQLKFMTSHDSSFVHCVARLVKFWFKSLSFKDKRVYGGSTIMELIAVVAAEEEERNFNPTNIVRAFNRALERISKLDSIRLAFHQISEDQWTLVPIRDLTVQNHAEVVPEVVGTMEILKRQYFIIEPANPYNDLLGDKDKLVIDRLKHFATVTRQRLADLMSGKGQYLVFDGNKNKIQVDIMMLFEPQPAKLYLEFPLGVTNDVLITYCMPYNSMQCDMKVRNEKVYAKEDVQLFVETMKLNLIATVNSTVKTQNSSATENGVVKTNSNAIERDVEKSIKRLIKTTLDKDMGPAPNRKHEDCDITLTIPYQINNVGYATRCSFRWK